MVAFGAGALAPPGWARDAFLYVTLGVFPGLALAEALWPGASRGRRLALGLALAPLVATLAGDALLATGVSLARAGWLVAIVTAALWLAMGWRADRGRGDPAAAVAPLPRPVWIVAIGLAIAVAIPPLVNAYVAVRGDTWTHAGIVMQVLERPVPPEDPRFAGIPLHYPWFYNLFIAMACALRGGGPFTFMTVLNVATAYATVVLVAHAAQRLWRTDAAASGAAVLGVFGLNAGAFLLWPAYLIKAFVGKVQGIGEVVRQLRTIELGNGRVIASLSAPFALMVSLLDKLLVGSPLAYAYLLMIVHLVGLLAWLEEGRPRDLVLVAAGAAGMMLFHGVVALSVIPVWLGTLVLAILLRARSASLPSYGRLGAAFAVTLAAALACTPYLLSVASGWQSSRSGLRHSYLTIDAVMPWTLLTAGALVWGFAWRPSLEAWRERRPVTALLSLGLAAMLVFACIVKLPEHNEAKFVYQAFISGLLLAAPGFWTAFERVRLHSRPMLRVALAMVFLVPFVLTLQGYIRDPGRTRDPSVRERPGEGAMDRWLREHTPRDAVVVDSHYRDLVMVRGRRVLYLGTEFGPERAAFPLDQVIERRRVVADLYGAARDPETLNTLERFGRPLYVLFRPEEDGDTGHAWSVWSASRDRFEIVYQSDGYRVLRLVPMRPVRS